MADDRELNPGQDYYDDLYSHNGQINDADNRAAQNWATDYSDQHSSSSRDYLRQGEQASLTKGASQPKDLSKQENQATYHTSGFDSNSKNRRANKSAMRGMRKKAIVAGLTLLCGSGLLITGFTALSGPMQFVHVANMGRDYILNITDNQKKARSASSSRSIARILNKGADAEEYKMNNRVGILARAQAKAQTDRLAARGVSFKTDGNGYSAGMDIDMKKYLGKDNPTESQIRKVVKDMDIGDKFSIDGSKLTINSNLSYSEMKRSIRVLDDPGKWSVRSWMQTRATLKRQGFTSWLHPFQKLKNAADKKIFSLLKKALGKIDNIKKKSQKGRDQDDDFDDAAKDNDVDIDSANDNSAKLIDKALEASEKIAPRATKGVRKIVDIGNNVNSFLSANPIQIARIIISVVCTVRDITNVAGPYKMSNIANVAEKGAVTIMGIGSQVMTGEDITMDDLGDSAQQFFYNDNIQATDIDGKETGKKITSSFYTSPEVSCTLGANCNKPRPSDLTDQLSSVEDASNIFGAANIANFITAVLDDSSFTGTLIGGLCVINNLTGFLDMVGQWASDGLNALLSAFNLQLPDVFGALLSKFINFLYGTPIDLVNATPRQWGSIFMFGTLFTSNDHSLMAGGRKLASQQAYALNIENRRYLAWENRRKPLLARLFDVSDYSSSISQLARSAQIDTSSQDWVTQLANVFKVFNAAPTIIADASSQLLGGSAYAAAAYDYGVPTYAWSLDDMNNLVAGGEEYDMINNAYEVTKMLEEEDNSANTTKEFTTTLHKYAERCLTVKIGDKNSDFKVSPINNENGEAWNYVDNATNNAGDCNNLSQQEKYKKLSLYVMDYFNTVSGMCYEGDESDKESAAACKEMSVESGTSKANAIDMAGNQDPEVWQGSFVDESKDGTYQGYDTRTNGCTTISAWFVMAHTDLQYGHGNGKEVVQQLVSANPNAGLEITDKPTKAPALFSTISGGMGATQTVYGHTGLVTSIDADGTIHTLESGSGAGARGNPWSFTATHSPSDYASNTSFVYLGDHLKK